MNLEQMLYLGLIFVAVVSAVMGVSMVFGRTADVRQRLQGINGKAGVPGQGEDHWLERFARAAAPLSKFATPTDEEEVSQLRARFLHAGLRQAWAPAAFFAGKTALALALPLVFLIVTRLGGITIGAQVSMLLLLMTAAIGYYTPNVVLSRMIQARQLEIFEAFPDAIDLVIVCVEAGLGLDMALNKAAEELRLRSPELCEELDLVALELRVGSSRDRALRNFALRTGLDEVASFVTMLLQADRFGTSLAESLRVHADMLRTRRQLKAEEAAAKIALKLLFPLIFCIFPSLMLVLMGPAAIQIYRIMLPMMSGTAQ